MSQGEWDGGRMEDSGHVVDMEETAGGMWIRLIDEGKGVGLAEKHCLLKSISFDSGYLKSWEGVATKLHAAKRTHAEDKTTHAYP